MQEAERTGVYGGVYGGAYGDVYGGVYGGVYGAGGVTAPAQQQPDVIVAEHRGVKVSPARHGCAYSHFTTSA